MTYSATFEGLHKWHNHMFKKLGWMVLVKQKSLTEKDKGMEKKLDCYINSVKRLCSALREKITKIEEKDRKEDLEILLKNSLILYNFVVLLK